MALHPQTQPISFILAPSYHGATMLSWRLNHHQNIVSLGTGNPNRDESQTCSCGARVSDCPFWSQVHSYLDIQPDDPIETMLPQAPFITRNRTLNTWLNSFLAVAANEVGPRCWKAVYEQAERFFGTHDKFLTTAREFNPHNVYVDAERSNLKFMVMATMGFPVKSVIHLTRDPRAYVAAWKKYYPESPVEKLTLEWVAAHNRIKKLQNVFTRIPFLRMKYEDLIEKPVETFEEAVKFLRQKFVLVDEQHIDILSNHMIGLRPQDTEGGFAPRIDDWRESLHPEDQERVLKVAGPLFSEFRYKREN